MVSEKITQKICFRLVRDCCCSCGYAAHCREKDSLLHVVWIRVTDRKWVEGVGLIVSQNVPQGMRQKGTEGPDRRKEWGKGNEKESKEQGEECKI